MEHGQIIGISLILGAIVFSAFLLWTSERKGLVGLAGKGILLVFVAIAALIMVANGAAMLIYLSDRYRSPEFSMALDWSRIPFLPLWAFGCYGQ
jgi:hypothetical protein